jgi:hypothetical protein
MDPDVEWAAAIAPLLGVEPVRGRDELRRFLTRDLPEGFDGFEATALSMEYLGDAVLVHTRFFGRGRASGVPVSLEAFSLVTLRNGKTVSYRDYDRGRGPRSRRAFGVGDVAGERQGLLRPRGWRIRSGSSSTLSIVRAPAALGSCSINSSSGGALFSGPRSPRTHG